MQRNSKESVARSSGFGGPVESRYAFAGVRESVFAGEKLRGIGAAEGYWLWYGFILCCPI